MGPSGQTASSSLPFVAGVDRSKSRGFHARSKKA